MGKTSVYLNRDLTAAWKASGLPLAELVRRGLGAPDLEAVIRGIGAALEQLGTLPATAVTDGTGSTGQPLPVAAIDSTAYELGSASDDCMHPAAGIEDGVCRACGTDMDMS